MYVPLYIVHAFRSMRLPHLEDPQTLQMQIWCFHVKIDIRRGLDQVLLFGSLGHGIVKRTYGFAVGFF